MPHPYALEISQDPLTEACADGMIYASGALDRNRDSAACASKGIVLVPDSEPVGVKPSRALKDEVIYEVHVRGLTMNDTSLPEAVRGTYAGAATKA
ncbi:hypothetical protein GCM10027514_17780 [Azotobacter armeniacus]